MDLHIHNCRYRDVCQVVSRERLSGYRLPREAVTLLRRSYGMGNVFSIVSLNNPRLFYSSRVDFAPSDVGKP